MHTLFRRVDVKVGSGSVIHIVQRIIPTINQSDNIAAVVSSDPQFSTLLAAVQAAGLANALSSTGLCGISRLVKRSRDILIYHLPYLNSQSSSNIVATHGVVSLPLCTLKR